MSAANQGKTQEYGDPRSSRQVEISGIVDVGNFTARIRVAHVIGEAASGFAGGIFTLSCGSDLLTPCLDGNELRSTLLRSPKDMDPISGDHNIVPVLKPMSTHSVAPLPTVLTVAHMAIYSCSPILDALQISETLPKRPRAALESCGRHVEDLGGLREPAN